MVMTELRTVLPHLTHHPLRYLCDDYEQHRGDGGGGEEGGADGDAEVGAQAVGRRRSGSGGGGGGHGARSGINFYWVSDRSVRFVSCLSNASMPTSSTEPSPVARQHEICKLIFLYKKDLNDCRFLEIHT